MSQNEERKSKEELENTIEDVQLRIDKLPEVGVFSIVIPFLVIIVFTALAVFAVGNIAVQKELAGKNLMGHVLGLMFFLMPIAFSFRYATKKLQIKRSRALLANIKARLENQLKDY